MYWPIASDVIFPFISKLAISKIYEYVLIICRDAKEYTRECVQCTSAI